MILNTEEKKDKMDVLSGALYSKDEKKIFEKRRHSLKDHGEYFRAPTSWKEEVEKSNPIKIPYVKILIGAFVFFMLAFGFATYKFFAGSNTVSGNNIDVSVAGPLSVSGGEEFSLEIEVKNNNNIDLQTVDLRIEYPDGVRNFSDLSTEVKRFSEVLGDIKTGESKSKIVKMVLFGEENTEKIIKIEVEYRIPQSNAIFSKQKDYTVVINSSPINIKVDGSEEINANQLIDYVVSVTSNSLSVINDLIIKVDYPFGFNVSSVSPESDSLDNSIFELGDLEPGAKRIIKINGFIQGQDSEQRTLKFTVGTPKKDDKNMIGTPFAFHTKNIVIKKPSIGLSIALNDSLEKEVSLSSGGRVRINMNWYNNLTERLYNVVLKVKIVGTSLDKNSFSVGSGFYNSSQDSVIFDKNKYSNFSVVDPGDEGGMSFNFSSIDQSNKNSSLFSNSNIKMEFTVLGSRAGNSISSQEVLFTDTRNIKISSDLRLLAKSFKTIGPFENIGPLPPKADVESTYTITLTATNSFNSIDNVKVSTFLPPNVKWTGYINPTGEKVTYNQGNGEVLWNIGTMKSDTGGRNPAKTLSFQVSIIPSISQVGLDVTLLNEVTISGVDAFSKTKVGETKGSVTTNIASDPEYFEDVGKVVR